MKPYPQPEKVVYRWTGGDYSKSQADARRNQIRILWDRKNLSWKLYSVYRNKNLELPKIIDRVQDLPTDQQWAMQFLIWGLLETSEMTVTSWGQDKDYLEISNDGSSGANSPPGSM